MNAPHITYFRLSKESRSGGLGLDAQRQAVAHYLQSVDGVVIGTFTEIESGKRNDRKQLVAAIEMCRKTKARLCIAKLDRLARNAAFLLSLRDSGVDFVAADMPHADRLTVGIMAVFAEHERDLISARTKSALREAKRRGVRLGNPRPKVAAAASAAVRHERAVLHARNLLPIVAEIRRAGVTTLRGVAVALNARGLRTRRGNLISQQAVSDLLRKSHIFCSSDSGSPTKIR